MISLGDEDPRAAEVLDRALFIVQQQIDHLMQHFSLNNQLPEKSEIYRLQKSTGKLPLNVETVLQVALHSASVSLQQIAYFISNPVATTRVALHSLMRVALLGTARTAFVLLPNDPEQRLTNVKIILAQDCQSGIRALQEYAKFQDNRDIAPPPELLEGLLQQRELLYPKGRVPGEGAMIKRQTEAFIQALQLAEDEQHSAEIASGPEILRNHASWLWNTYSGLAHAYTWPLMLPGISPDRRK